MGKARVLPLLLAALTLCMTAFPASAAEKAQSATAVTMQLMKTEGTVKVTNSSGRGLTKRDNMRLYNGYHVETKAKSYAWINLDGTKLVKLDAVSEAEVRKSGKALELLLSSGSFYFNVTSPLKEEETLNIRTATMVVGIRGTSGWFKAVDRWSTEIYVLEGTVQCNVSDPVTGQVKEATIQSGEMAVATAYPQDWEGDKCDIVQERFEPGDIDGFVLEELAQDPGLCADIYDKSGLDVLSAVEATQERREQDEQKMQDTLDRIGEQQTEQDNNTSTGPVWGQEDPAPSKPDSSTGTGGGSGGDEGGSSGGNDSGDVPKEPYTATLTMPQTAEEVQRYLYEMCEKEVQVVTLLSGGEGGDTLTIDIDMIIPPKITLAVTKGINVIIQSGSTLTVNGTMVVNNSFINNGVLTNNGLITASGITGSGELNNFGTINSGISKDDSSTSVGNGEVGGGESDSVTG